MKSIVEKSSQGLYSMAVRVSSLIVNTTCYYKLYQEKLPAEFDKLKKHVK